MYPRDCKVSAFVNERGEAKPNSNFHFSGMDGALVILSRAVQPSNPHNSIPIDLIIYYGYTLILLIIDSFELYSLYLLNIAETPISFIYQGYQTRLIGCRERVVSLRKS